MTGQQVARFSELPAHHGEGPLWDVSGHRVIWVDMLAGAVMVSEIDGQTRRIDLNDPIAAFVRPIVGSEDFVVVGERTVWRINVDEPNDSPRHVADLPFSSEARANDGTCSPSGDLYVGSMHYGAEDAKGEVLGLVNDVFRAALDKTTISNGQQFLPDGSVVFVDSADRQIRRFRVADDGRWVDPFTICVPEEAHGTPDGLCIDSEGGIWVAMWNGGCVMRWSPDGRLTTVIDLPVRQPTSVALGGETLQTLFITTSAFGLEPATDPLAGYLLTAEVDVPGVLPYAWQSGWIER